jgi:hypothetical protein
MSASAFRSRIAKPGTGKNGNAAQPQAWDAWKEWGNGLVPSHAFARDMEPGIGVPPNVIWMKKEKGKWSFSSAWSIARDYRDGVSGFNEIARRKPSCADAVDKTAAK